MSPFIDKAKVWLEAWFSSGHKEFRSEKQLEQEKYYLWHPRTGRFNRWIMWLPVLVAQICIGSLYSWSIFNSSMDSNVWVPLGGKPGANANAFTVGIAFFGLGTLVFGNWIERNGPYYAVRRTLLLTPAGWAFAALASYIPNYGLLLAGFGICHGLGCAHAYISTCASIQKWFPEFKGFATGVAVMGFGVGSFIWTSVGNNLLKTIEKPLLPYQVQGIFAAIFFVALLLVLPLLRNPPPDFAPTTMNIASEKSCRGAFVRAVTLKANPESVVDRHYSFLGAITTLEFGLVCLFVFGQFITGVVFLSSASDMTKNIFGKSDSDANFITSMLNLCNFVGRFGFGFLSDKIGRKNFYILATATQAFAVGLMSIWIEKGIYGLWILSFLLIGAMYGGGFGVLPAFMSDLFGPKISAATHGVTISVWALCAVVGIPIFTSFTGKYTMVNAAGKTVGAPQAYIYNCYWLCGLPAMALVVLLFLNVRNKDRQLRRSLHQCRVRVFKYVLACKLVTPAAQEAEWAEYVAKRDAEAAAAAAAAPKADVEAPAAIEAAAEPVAPAAVELAVAPAEAAPEVAKA